MWSRDKRERGQQPRQRRRSSSNAAEGEGKECRRSQAVQVSPQRVRAAESAAEAGVQVDVGNFEANDVGDAAAATRSTGDQTAGTAAQRSGRVGAGGTGGSRIMWRWPSSRRLEHEPAVGDANTGGGKSSRSSSFSPGRVSLRRRGRGSVPAAVAASPPALLKEATTAAPAPVSTSSGASATTALARLRRRRSLPPSTADAAGAAAGATAAASDIMVSSSRSSSSPDRTSTSGESDTSTTAAAAAAAASLLAEVAASLDSNENNDDDDDDGVDDDQDDDKRKTTKNRNIPGCLVASVLVRNNNGDNKNTNSNNGDVLEPVSPTNSITSIASEGGGGAPGWAERAGLCGGVAVVTTSRRTFVGTRGGRAGVVRKRSPLGNEFTIADDDGDDDDNGGSPPVAVKNDGSREVPRFLRPVMVLLTLSLLAIGGTLLLQASRREGWGGGGMVLLGPAAYAAGGVQLPEAVVDDIFERADKDNDGVIGDEEIQFLVERAGGSLLDDASEIEAGVKSVIKNLDGNADHALSRSDLNTYWDRLGTLLTVDEAAQWVLHAAQLPQEVADAFVNNMVTGYDFPELAARQGALLEQDLGVTRPAFKRNLVRSMQWKLWGMGEEPAAPSGLRAANASACGAVSLSWDPTTPANSRLGFPVHKYVLRRAPLGQEGEKDGDWVTVMASPNSAFFDAGLQPGAAYRYALQAWNALGHSGSVEIDVVVATEDCALGRSWFWSPGGGGNGGADSAEASFGGLILATVVSVAAAFCFRALGGGGGGGGGDGSSESKKKKTTLSPGGFDRGSSGGSNSSGISSSCSSSSSSSRREVDRRRRPDGGHVAVAGTATGKTAVSDGGSAGGNGRRSGSPIPRHSSGGSEWSDLGSRENIEAHRRLSGSGAGGKPSSSRLAGSKDRLRRTSSDVTATGGGAAAAAAVAGSSANGGGTGRLPSARGLNGASVGESVRKQRAKRLHMTSRHGSSRDERDVCKECGKEWRWFWLGKHTCCKCHEQFCDRKECGSATHAFGACPVGGLCMCSSCLQVGGGGGRRVSSARSFDR